MSAMTLAHGAALIARVALAGVFAVAAIGKLKDLDGTREGVTALASPSLAFLTPALPSAELVIALGLLIPATSGIAATAAIILLLIFSALMIRAMRRGQAPVCHCFGIRSGQTINATMIARNSAFIALAFVAVVA
jgi:uncharacterized membrane protein YphA (DoxX/SURF4 family)